MARLWVCPACGTTHTCTVAGEAARNQRAATGSSATDPAAMSRQRVLVCGATGFIGRNLVESLSRRGDLEIHAVRFTRPAYDLPGVVWHRADLRDAA